MSCAQTENLQICKGTTFSRVIRWEAEPFIYTPITAITQAGPTRVTSTSHGIPDGWRVAVVSAGGMTQINAQNDPPKAKDFRVATRVDADTVEFNALNSSAFRAYTSGGYLQFYTPVDLTGYSARMAVKDRVGGVELLALTNVSGIMLDPTTATITIQLDAATTAALTWKKGVYDLELESPAGVVTSLVEGVILVEDVVTT